MMTKVLLRRFFAVSFAALYSLILSISLLYLGLTGELLGYLIIVILLAILLLIHVTYRSKNKRCERRLRSIPGFAYSYFFDGEFIGIDPTTKTIHLRSRFGVWMGDLVEKTYHFNDVREWRYETWFSRIDLDALITMFRNGFYIRVRDVQYPEW